MENEANAFPTLTFEEVRNPKWHRTLGERRNTDIQNYSDPNRRNIIATAQFSAFQLNDLIARVAGEYTANELVKHLTDAGAAEAALRVAECMETYGHGERQLKEYAQDIKANRGYMRDKDDYDSRGHYVRGRDKKAPRGLELAKALMGRHAECRLYKFLQYKEQEMQEAGLLDIPEDDPEKGAKGKRKGEILSSAPKTIFFTLRNRRKAHWQAVKEVYEAGNDWWEHWASRYQREPTAWHDWDRMVSAVGADHFNPKEYARYVEEAAAIAHDRERQRTDTAMPIASEFMYGVVKDLEYPNWQLVSALMQSSLRVALEDKATLLSAAGLPAKWVPEVVREALFAPNLEVVCVNIGIVCKHMNQLPMFHPHLPAAFAVLAKIRDFLEALREACKKYKLGSTEVDQISCPDNMREPMYPEMGERPEFLGRTVEEVMRAYASGIAVVGNIRQRDGLKFPNYPDEEMKERLREEGQIPIIQQREVMPVRGFGVVQSRAIEPGAPQTVLQVMVRNTNLVMAARSAIALVGSSRIHRSIFTPVSVTRGLARHRRTGEPEPEFKSKRGYTVHKPKTIEGHPIWDMASMTTEKCRRC